VLDWIAKHRRDEYAAIDCALFGHYKRRAVLVRAQPILARRFAALMDLPYFVGGKKKAVLKSRLRECLRTSLAAIG
jgi:hypothetical protein